jgi:hypothetical protein
LTVCKFSHCGCSWNEAGSVELVSILGLTASKFSLQVGGWSWDEADGVDLLMAFLD